MPLPHTEILFEYMRQTGFSFLSTQRTSSTFRLIVFCGSVIEGFGSSELDVKHQLHLRIPFFYFTEDEYILRSRSAPDASRTLQRRMFWWMPIRKVLSRWLLFMDTEHPMKMLESKSINMKHFEWRYLKK